MASSVKLTKYIPQARIANLKRAALFSRLTNAATPRLWKSL